MAKQPDDGADIAVTLIDDPAVSAGWIALWQRLLRPLPTETIDQAEEAGDDDAE